MVSHNHVLNRNLFQQTLSLTTIESSNAILRHQLRENQFSHSKYKSNVLLPENVTKKKVNYLFNQIPPRSRSWTQMSQRATYQTENETQNIVINVVSSTQVKVGNLNVTKGWPDWRQNANIVINVVMESDKSANKRFLRWPWITILASEIFIPATIEVSSINLMTDVYL